MTAFFLLVWDKVKGWAIAVGSALAVVWYIYTQGRSSAKKDAEIDRARDKAERNAHAANEIDKAARDRSIIEAEVDSMSGDSALDRLRREWQQSDRKD